MSPPVTPSPSMRALVAGLVDYAGLFPPASHGMAEAAARYASHLESADAWMLGRFVVPVERLAELAADAARHVRASTPWRLSALVGDDPVDDAGRIHAFNVAQRGRFIVDAAEARVASTERVELVTHALGTGLEVYIELPYEPDPRSLLTEVRRAGARAKIRTGGVTPDAFPAPAQVARFIVRCAESGVPFKATAGLHHPLRGEHAVTYEHDAPRATMFGFLNVFVAGALASLGTGEAELIALLEEREHSAFTFDADGVRWRTHRVSNDQLVRARSTFAVAFGSCSFREPVTGLRELALL